MMSAVIVGREMDTLKLSTGVCCLHFSSNLNLFSAARNNFSMIGRGPLQSHQDLDLPNVLIRRSGLMRF